MFSVRNALLVLASVWVAAAPMGEADARHLLARTGFGPRAEEVAEYAKLDHVAAADKLLKEIRTVAITPPPDWVDSSLPSRAAYKDKSDDDKKAVREMLREQGLDLRAWWYSELLLTPSPLTEKMTLFWHNHLVSAQQKVKLAPLMYRQNVLLRQEALGNFGRLLHSVARDPAMLVYLDGVQNRKGQPNENFAREVMELFTLGEGHYTEQDIREAARALTGMSLERPSGEYRFRPALHDDGEKVIFGHRGKFDGDAFLDLILARPETAEFIVSKLWREFISPEPDAAEVRKLAKVFRDSHYELKPLMRALLTSNAFYAPANRGVLVKSPVEITVGTFRQFGINPPEWDGVMAVNRGLGQDLFNPPNVKGWPGYTDWINSQTLLARKQLLGKVFRAAEMDATPVAMMLPSTGKGDKASKLERATDRAAGGRRGYDLYVDQWLEHVGGVGRAALLLLPLSPDVPPTGTPVEMVGQLIMNPLFQLK